MHILWSQDASLTCVKGKNILSIFGEQVTWGWCPISFFKFCPEAPRATMSLANQTIWSKSLSFMTGSIHSQPNNSPPTTYMHKLIHPVQEGFPWGEGRRGKFVCLFSKLPFAGIFLKRKGKWNCETLKQNSAESAADPWREGRFSSV